MSTATQTKPGADATGKEALVGLLAQFGTVWSIVEAAKRIRAAGYARLDVHTPFPIHGIDPIIGIRPTRLPWLVLCAGLFGLAGGIALQWFANAADYQYLISGKPIWSLPANIPVAFETTILCSALMAVFGMLWLNRLPTFHNPLFRHERFRRATSDRFFIFLDATDEGFDLEAATALLERAGASAIERVEGARVSISAEPRIPPIQDMAVQPKYRAQSGSTVFADGRAMRLPISGVVARGRADDDDHYYRGYSATTDAAGNETLTYLDGFPSQVDVTPELLSRGEQRFNIYCAACHGRDGSGSGPVHRRAAELAAQGEANWTPSMDLNLEQVRTRPAGHIYNTINMGIRNMPAHGPQIPVSDRWAIVAYVRALQLGRGTPVLPSRAGEAPAAQLAPAKTK